MPSSDPNLLQWITGVGQVLAVSGAAFAAFYAARGARAAEQNVEAQTRPLLLDVPYAPYTNHDHEIALPNGTTVSSAWRGEVLANAGEGWLIFPVRNVGKGVARIDRMHAYFNRRQDYGLYAHRSILPPNEETHIGLRVVEGDPGAREALGQAIKGLPPFHVTVHYTDLAGGQGEYASFDLGPTGASARLQVLHVEHGRDQA